MLIFRFDISRFLFGHTPEGRGTSGHLVLVADSLCFLKMPCVPLFPVCF